MSRDQHALKAVSNTALKERETVECTGKKVQMEEVGSVAGMS